MPVVVATAALAGGLAAPAMADTSSISVAGTTATPEQSFPADLSFSGTNALTGAAEVEAIVRPAGGPSCQSSYQEDTYGVPSARIRTRPPGARVRADARRRPPSPRSHRSE
jgi:hypothetical protein